MTMSLTLPERWDSALIVGRTPWPARDALVPLLPRRVRHQRSLRSRPGGRLRTRASAPPSKCVLSLGLYVLMAQAAFGQAAGAHLAFEKADVHISAPGAREEGGFLPDGRFECRATTMLKLISVAYGVDMDRVAGGPDWLATNRFDIVAKAPSRKASRPDLVEMLRGLLADRFGLASRKSTRTCRYTCCRWARRGRNCRRPPIRKRPTVPPWMAPRD